MTERPSARGYHAMAYDAARRTVVLLGGYDGTDLGDTWEWSNGAWTDVSLTRRERVVTSGIPLWPADDAN